MNDTQTPPFPAWIALDMDDFEECLRIVEITYPVVSGFKLHASAEDKLQEKLEAVRSIAGNSPIWWDRKAHDTPDTVAAIARTAAKCNVTRMTVHAGGGILMMMVAVEHGPNDIVAITDLTSLTPAEVGILSGTSTISSTLLKAQWAKLAEVSHVVCSANEVGVLNAHRAFHKLADRHLELHELDFIVPGTRTTTSVKGSQERSGTAMQALRDGADELVFGSEVYKSEQPLETILSIYDLVERDWEENGIPGHRVRPSGYGL